MCKDVVKKLFFVIRYIPHCCKNQQMCDEAVDNYHHGLKFVPDYYNTQKMCNKPINTYHSINTICSWPLYNSRNM